jgi:hypothetical protein
MKRIAVRKTIVGSTMPPANKNVVWKDNDGVFNGFSDGEWKPLTGGSGSGSTLSILKAFIDSHNINGYDYTGKCIGVTANALTFFSNLNDVVDITNADTTVVNPIPTEPFNTYNILAFDIERGVFMVSGIYSGDTGTSKRFIFIPISTKTITGNITKSVVAQLLSPDDINTVLEAIEDESPNPDKLGWVYYDDLK